MSRHPIALAVLVAAALTADPAGAPTALAHDGATGVVKKRMESMKTLAGEMKGLGRVFRGEVAYDPAVVEAAAGRIEAYAGGHLTRLFPQGSLDDPSEASEEIWGRWAEFQAGADEMGARASALAAAAGLGTRQAKRAFAALTDTCKACHREFKED